MTTIEIANKIRENLQYNMSLYFTIENSRGEEIKIRTSNHSCNKSNNGIKTLSFITERTKQMKSAFNQSFNEWAMLDNGLTDTYEEIEYILENEI